MTGLRDLARKMFRHNWRLRRRKLAIEVLALICMAFAFAGATQWVLWEWWPFAVIAGMFFIAANLDLLRSFSIGPSGVAAEMRDLPHGPIAETRETWKERERLELYVIANLSIGDEPNRLPINRDPALSRFRLLKDAAKDGKLRYDGETPNAFATVSRDDFVEYAEESGIEDFKRIAEDWCRAHEGRATLAPPSHREQARFRLARLRTAGVALRNRAPSSDEIDAWTSEVKDWAQAVVAEIEKIDPADAEWFRTLDAVPPPRVRFAELDPSYVKTFRELDFMLMRLERLLIDKYSLGGKVALA